MDRSVTFFLLEHSKTRDDLQQWVEVETSRAQVFGQVSSVTGNEYFSAGMNGIKPELRFTMFAYDYNGERELEYDDIVYSIYRTYRGKNDTLELYVERRAGDGIYTTG